MTALPMLADPAVCTCRPVLVFRFVREALVGIQRRHCRGCTRPPEPVDVKTWRKS